MRNKRFNDLYRKYYKMLYRLAFRKLEDAAAAEDAVQETFLKMLFKLDAILAHPNPAGWLTKTLNYVILHYIDSQKRPQATELPENLADPALPQGGGLSDMLPQGLKSEERELLTLFFEKEWSYEEIAAHKKITVNTCRVQLHRAKNNCRQLLEKENSEIF